MFPGSNRTPRQLDHPLALQQLGSLREYTEAWVGRLVSLPFILDTRRGRGAVNCLEGIGPTGMVLGPVECQLPLPAVPCLSLLNSKGCQPGHCTTSHCLFLEPSRLHLAGTTTMIQLVSLAQLLRISGQSLTPLASFFQSVPTVSGQSLGARPHPAERGIK